MSTNKANGINNGEDCTQRLDTVKQGIRNAPTVSERYPFFTKLRCIHCLSFSCLLHIHRKRNSCRKNASVNILFNDNKESL